MKKIVLLLLIFKISLVFSEDFDSLMGKGKNEWRFVQTAEDKRRLEGFKSVFEKQALRLAEKIPPSKKIPKVFHFVWLGPEPFPKESLARISKWMALHPKWTFKFWTDIERGAPLPGMEVRLVDAFTFEHLGSEFYHSINYGEKAKILAYEILLAEGGVYLDHDTVPVKEFDSLNRQFHFYCGLEKLGPSLLSSSVIPATHLIGATRGHPILLETVSWLQEHWDQFEDYFTDRSKLEMNTRIVHRTFWALSEGIDQKLGKKGNSDVVFPVSYFSEKIAGASSFAVHHHDGKWAQSASHFEKKMHKKLQEMIHKEDNVIFLTFFLAGVSFLGCVFLLFYARRARKFGFFLLIASLQMLSADEEFERLMGKETEHWTHVSKAEDLAVLKQLGDLYEKNKNLRFTAEGPYKIPNVIHFIWLGPKPFPPESVENVRTWLAHHPEWKVKLWTDRKRLPPCNDMEMCYVEDFPFLFLRHCYEESNNWGEKSDVLRFEILYQEGGVYTDHDANCLQKFDGLHRAYDFYCGLELPHSPFAGKNITSGIGVLGSRSFHPVIGRTIELIGKQWKALGQKYPGRDGYSRTQLVMERTYLKMTDSFQDRLSEDGNVDIVLPSAYFFAKKGVAPIYSRHFFANSWADETEQNKAFEKEATKALSKLQKRNRTIRWVGMGALFFNLVAFAGIFIYLRRRKKRSSQ